MSKVGIVASTNTCWLLVTIETTSDGSPAIGISRAHCSIGVREAGSVNGRR